MTPINLSMAYGSGESYPVTHRTEDISGLKMFYREAGAPNAPVILLPHGFPSSWRMFTTLFPLLSSRYRLIAQDFPGFGHSELVPEKWTPRSLLL